jgi:ATP-dependent DNA ligase
VQRIEAVSRLKLRRTILDGEIIAVDENGIPRFQLLQRFQKRPTAATVYFIFDVLWADGMDITTKTLLERRAVLASIIGLAQQRYVKSHRNLLRSPHSGPHSVAETRRDR